MDPKSLGRQFYKWREPMHLVTPEGVTEVSSDIAPPIHPTSGDFSYAYAAPRVSEETIGLPNAFVDRYRDGGKQRYSVVTSHIPTDMNYSDMNANDFMSMINAADSLDQDDEYGMEASFSTMPRARMAADSMAKRRIEGRNPRTGRRKA